MSTKTTRRSVLGILAGLGIGSETYRRAVAAQVVEGSGLTEQMLQQAEWVAGIELTREERESTLRRVEQNLGRAKRLRDVPVNYNVPPCVHFQPAPFRRTNHAVIRNRAAVSVTPVSERPKSDTELAFLPVTHLAHLLRQRKVTSLELTKLYLERLKKYDPLLQCVVTLTEELALRLAKRADAEMDAGEYRGPLHGIPWGAKDLMAVPGYKTTWGATPLREQEWDHEATIAQRLEDAGAVLVAKLSLGALAMGDRWMGKMTRNPWNPEQGSSGSSAGSASATSAGLVGFSIGTETLGSIVSPSRRCGSTGLRPTFGRISRYGLMPLSWTMDKAGPICRSVEDCALVLDAIHGADGRDPCAVDEPFLWPPTGNLRKLKVGYIRTRESDAGRADLAMLRALGVTLVPISLPNDFPVWELTTMLNVEAATMFDQMTRDHIEEGLNSWPDTFRAAQFVPAVEYLRAARVRTLLMQAMEEVMEQVDMYVGGRDLGITNLTGHPTVVMPLGFREQGELQLPHSITMTGQLYGEANLLAVAKALEKVENQNRKQPPLDSWLQSEDADGED